MMTKFEQAKLMEKKLHRMDRFLTEYKRYPHLVLSRTKARKGSFWSDDGTAKRENPIPNIMDLPDDIGLYNEVIALIYSYHDKLKKEYEQLIREING